MDKKNEMEKSIRAADEQLFTACSGRGTTYTERLNKESMRERNIRYEILKKKLHGS